jgi:hypothetical protein
MKKITFDFKKALMSSGLSIAAVSSFGQIQNFSDTLQHTGSPQTYVIPECASNVVIITYGAQGAAGSTLNSSINVGGQAGLGNRVEAAWPNLLPGQTIHVYVGGAANGASGGWNGGGNGLATNGQNPSGGGGGATDIRFPTNALSDRVQVAGGGGGGGNAAYHWQNGAFTGGDGGNGGGNQVLNGNSLNGSAGTDALGDVSAIYPSGQGGTTAGPGAGALGCSSFLGQTGGANSGEVGGAGGLGSSLEQTFYRANGGAGGGGYIGGNGGGGGSAGTVGCSGNNIGAGGGGSAGTNYANGGEPTTFENGVRQGNGLVVIQYSIVPEMAELSLATTPCVGQEATLTFSPAGGTFSVLQGSSADVSANGVFSPSATGTYQIVYAYTDACTNLSSADTVTVNIACDVAGLEGFDHNFKVYPNPTENTLFVQSSAVLGQVVISDARGQIVLSLESSTNLLEIDVRHLYAGIYFVQTANGIQRFVVK